MTETTSSTLSFASAHARSPWGTYLTQVETVKPDLGPLARWADTRTRPKRALIVDVPIEMDDGSIVDTDSMNTGATATVVAGSTHDGEREAP